MKAFLLRLLGRARTLESKPVKLGPDVLEEMTDYMRRDIASGFYDPEQIITTATEIMEDRILPDAAERTARSLMPKLIADQLIAERSWPAETDCDRLDRAFAALEADGIIARQNFTCCGTCGAYEIGDEISAAQAEGRPARGYAFYHQQDTERAVEGDGVYLNYGALQEGEEPALAVAAEIVRTIEAHGLTTAWDGKLERRIAVQLDWKRRWPYAAQAG